MYPDPPASNAKGGEKANASLMLAYKGAIYAFIYRHDASGEMENKGLPGAFLEVLEDELTGQVILDLNAGVFYMTRNHAIDWLKRTSAGNSSPLTLTMKSAVDVDYLKIWRMSDLGFAKRNSWEGYSDNNQQTDSNQQTIIFDMGSVRRVVALSLTYNDTVYRPYRISIMRTSSSNDGIVWTVREGYADNRSANRDLKLFHFINAVSARYFKFEINPGKKR